MKDRERNVLSLLENKTNIYSDRVALGIKTTFGWKEFTYNGLGLMSRRIATHLMNDLDIQKGERIAILSESKPEYGACVFASIIAGAVTVPLDIKLTISELTSILSDCEPTVIFASQAYVDKALKLQQIITSIKHVIVIDEQPTVNSVESIYNLPANYTCKWRHRSRKSTLFYIYTSGTTGAPKGVETTFGNILAQLDDLKYPLNEILAEDDARILSILPMNHLFEMTVGFSTFLNYGFSVYYTQSLKPKDILSIMRDKKIQFMIVVPAFLKLLKAGIESEIKKSSKLNQLLFKGMYHMAKFLPCRRIKKVLFKKIHDSFGGSFLGCVAGGAPLDVEVGEFFQRIGLRVYQGYGLTETSPVVSVDTDKFWRDLSSVGKPLRSYKVKVDKASGELLLAGPSIMKGYHNQPELTAQTIDEDGWFHTGDIAKIDARGHIYITGRIKNMIVLSGGKKVFPEEVETVLEKSEYFQEICVLGVPRSGGAKDGTEDIAAVILPKEELLRKYDDETVNKMIKDEVKRLGQKLAPYKRPMNINIVKEPLPRTSTRKIKRNLVKELVKA